MDYQFIKIEKQQHRMDIILNNAPVNILTGEVMLELIDVLKTGLEDKSLRVVVLKGHGKAWSAGADVGEHLPENFVNMLAIFGELCWRVRTYPVPMIAAVHGICLGGGCELAALCDFIIAGESAKFGQPEIKVGVIPPAACAHYARKYGLGTALEIILTGDTFDAATFHKMGVVKKVVADRELDNAVDQFVSRIIGNSGEILRIAKTATLKAIRRSPKKAGEKVDEIYHDKLMKTHDAVEGLNAFLQKRNPDWKDM